MRHCHGVTATLSWLYFHYSKFHILLILLLLFINPNPGNPLIYGFFSLYFLYSFYILSYNLFVHLHVPWTFLFAPFVFLAVQLVALCLCISIVLQRPVATSLGSLLTLPQCFIMSIYYYPLSIL